MVVFEFLFILLRITLGSSAGKELSPWLSTRAVVTLRRRDCMCSFPVGCLGQDMEFDCIGSWSLPFHQLRMRKMSPK